MFDVVSSSPSLPPGGGKPNIALLGASAVKGNTPYSDRVSGGRISLRTVGDERSQRPRTARQGTCGQAQAEGQLDKRAGPGMLESGQRERRQQ
jgi:hypothetical protein